MIKKLFLITSLLVVSQAVCAQMFPERKDIRKGNKQYERQNYVESEAAYMGALSSNPMSYEGNFNLGNTYYRQGRYEEAAQRFMQLGQAPHLPETMAHTFYNAGNSLVQQYKESYDRQKLEQALETYKQSLRLNPNDQEAKFNLAYVQKLLERDNDGDGGGGGDDQNQDGDGDQNPDQNGEGDQDPDSGDGENDPNEGDPDEKEDKNDPDNPDKPEQSPEQERPEPRMSPEEAAQMLNAMQNNEESAREKMEAQPAGAVGASGKNW